MNRTSSPEAAHLDEGDIVRYHDRELEDGARERVEEHLAACHACSDRLGLFGERSSEVTDCTRPTTSTVPPEVGRATRSPGILPSMVSSTSGPEETNARPATGFR